MSTRISRHLRVLLLLTTIGIVACSDGRECDGRDDLVAEITKIVNDSQRVSFDLRDVTKFEWSRLNAFKEYDSASDVRSRTGLDYQPSWWQSIHVPESRTLLVFSEGGSVCFVETKNAKAPGANWAFGASILGEHGIDAENAKFRIDRAGGVPILEIAVGQP